MIIIIATIKDVLAKERDAISYLIDNIDEAELIKTVDIIKNCRGRVIFMGVGKSGHIGKKLAATFASLGIPSFFVHSTEAMHGDLGMILKDDVAILISNSGNTAEVVQNVPFVKANGAVTVAFTSKKESKLAKLCDALLLIPALPEADSNALAPTVSSTLTLALGDELACALSEAKAFSRDDFHKFHPGGALGNMLSNERK